MSAWEATAILFPLFIALVAIRVPVAIALGLACIPVFLIEDRLTPVLLMNEMFKSYNAFLLLAVPFFLLAANIMNAAGITDRLIRLSKAMVGHLPGGLGHVNVVVSMLFAGISGSSTADAAGIGSLLIPQMKKEGYSTSFSVAITACSSVMGVVIPPSILMVVWGGLMSVSIGGLFLAGVVPGILIAASQMGAVYVFAKIYNYPTTTRSTFRQFGKAVVYAIPPLDDTADYCRWHCRWLFHADRGFRYCRALFRCSGWCFLQNHRLFQHSIYFVQLRQICRHVVVLHRHGFRVWLVAGVL